MSEESNGLSFNFDVDQKGTREVMRITSDGRIIMGPNISMDSGTQMAAELLQVQFGRMNNMDLKALKEVLLGIANDDFPDAKIAARLALTYMSGERPADSIMEYIRSRTNS